MVLVTGHPELRVHTGLISVGQANGEAFEPNLRYSYEPQQNPLIRS